MQKTVLITGATKGIGKAIALRLAAEGYSLVLNYANDDEEAGITLQECLSRHANIALAKGNVSVKEDVRHIVHTALDKFGSLDAVINNAGLNIDKPFPDLSEEDWDRVVDVNMKGIFLVCQESVRHMRENENGGSIINVGSTTGIRGRKNGINYCASKAGVIVMTKCLAMELGPAIRVNCLIPGFTWTGETEKDLISGKMRQKNWKKEISRWQGSGDRKKLPMSPLSCYPGKQPIFTGKRSSWTGGSLCIKQKAGQAENEGFTYICGNMAKEKIKPVPVRFNPKVLEILKEEEKIDTPQQALNFLTHFWENNRPAKPGFEPELSVSKTPDTAPAIPSKIPKSKPKEAGSAEPPPGLSGIDLSIWKAEQKEKK